MKLGYIDYLNCYPFYHHMLEKAPLEGVTVFPGYPSTLNKMLAEGDLDMSPISAATCADIADRILLLPQFCLSSVGYVGSVILVSRRPIETLNRRTVGLTTASHTSVVLVKILLEKYYRVHPNYIETAPLSSPDETDAVLLIGNEAMIYRASPDLHVYDLGEIWLQKTGFPVVFAVFGVRKAILQKFDLEIQSVLRSYHASLQCLKKERKSVISHAATKYPDIHYDIDRYYSLLKFEFSDELKNALMFYLSTAGEMGFLKKVSRIDYFTPEQHILPLEKGGQGGF